MKTFKLSSLKKRFFLSLLITLALPSIAATMPTSTHQVSTPELVERGAYLAKLGDCEACHTIADGQINGGGRGFPMPYFGTIYSTNITPDKEFGIGHFSLDDFSRALREGVAPIGNLYPVMPYTSYDILTDADIEALYHYFMQLKPVTQQNRDNDLIFPANIRFGLKGWDLLNFSPEQFVVNSSKSEQWNRGNYIVNGLGHCGECHTPRDTMFAMDKSRHFQGAILEGAEASNITAKELNRQGWSKQDLSDLLRTGYSRKGTVFSSMYIIVQHSLSHLNDADMAAVTSYMLDSDMDLPAKPATFNGHSSSDPGYKLYMGYCAGCHGKDGAGIPNVTPALQANATIDSQLPTNILSVLLYGVPNQRYSHTRGFYAMPNYRGSLSVEQMTQLTNYLRKVWTKLDSNITAEQVQHLIDKLDSSVPDATN